MAVSLGVGMMPVVSPHIYEQFPSDFQVTFGSSITSTVLVLLALDLLFDELRWARDGLDASTGASIERAPDAEPAAAP